MGFDYFVFYTEASLICVIILATILITDRMYNTKQEKQVCFSRAIVAFMLYFISDGMRDVHVYCGIRENAFP